MRKINGQAGVLVNQLFQTLLVTYLLLLLIEQVWEGSVSTYLNLNWLLVLVIMAGIVDVFAEVPPRKEEKVGWKEYLFVGVLGAAGAGIVWLKTGELGWLRWVISIISGALIVLLSWLVLSED